MNSIVPIERLLAAALKNHAEAVKLPEIKRPRVSKVRKILNERRIRRLSDEFFKDTEPYRGKDRKDLTPFEQDAFRKRVKTLLLELDRQNLLYEQPFLEHFLEQGYMDTAEQFADRADEEDSGLEQEDVFQALRNVWIMNCLQTAWDYPVQNTNSVYAYSMLYPYTDNYIDDPSVSTEDKQGFNERLRERIQGGHPQVTHPDEKRVHELVGEIYTEYPPEQFPQVQAGLELILQGQMRSVRLNASPRAWRPETLEVCFYKGGASVLADACLVTGELSQERMAFAFHYGCFLQLIDDLQDMEEDKATGHHSVFTLLPDGVVADDEIKQLLAYIDYSNTIQPEDTASLVRMKEIITHFSRMMVLEVVGRDPELVSYEYYKELERSSHVRLSFYPQFGARIKAWMG